VWRIAVNKRKRAPHASLDDKQNNAALEQFCAVDSGTEQRVINDGMLLLLHSLIETLPSELRYVLTLSTVPEMTSSEISVALGIPSSSVRTRLFRARQLLKEKLAARLSPVAKPGTQTAPNHKKSR
jgi:RNA polymerase sigma-70 factor (ECF subfamily)